MTRHLEERIARASGDTAHDVGVELGRRMGPRLGRTIDRYLHVRGRLLSMAFDRLPELALPWLRELPPRFRDELTGLASGSGVPLSRVAEWAYAEAFIAAGCSSVLCRIDDDVWIAHNNDTFVPELWGHVTVREIAGRVPTMCFGIEGDVWATAGVNRAGLWLHVDHLEVDDAPRAGRPSLPSYGFLVDALETCETLADVAARLDAVDRDDGMLLFAVHGRDAAVFECARTSHVRRDLTRRFLVGTNHTPVGSRPTTRPDAAPHSTWARFDRLVSLLIQTPADALDRAALTAMLADDGVERRGEEFATAYSAVGCPGRREIWYTFGGTPAAGKGEWAAVPWPWPERGG